MQISPTKNQNFEKPSRNPSNRTKVKILKKKIFWISLKKNLVPLMLSHRGNVRTSKFWRKSKEKKRIFFENLRRAYKDLIKVKKKFKIISCLCTFNETVCFRIWVLLTLSLGRAGDSWVGRGLHRAAWRDLTFHLAPSFQH
jgi:hypothetical protein